MNARLIIAVLLFLPVIAGANPGTAWAISWTDPDTVYKTGGGWDNPTMIVTLDAKRRLSVPVSLAPAKGLCKN
ncbi:MAG TPA: hypothetical protein PKW32_18910 [Verrucomicrobiota bacterium]|nr:hypothetical protein [Verrucomicrobiota bacterium]